MTMVKHLEYQITRQLIRRRDKGAIQQGALKWQTFPGATYIWADRLIAILALTTCLLVLGSYLEELLWAAMAATTLFTLR